VGVGDVGDRDEADRGGRAGQPHAGARLEGAGLHVTPGLVVVLALGAATWASIGTAVSALIPSAEAAWPLLALTYLPLVVLSGSFGSVVLLVWAAAGLVVSMRWFCWQPRAG
jgi:hypothetical protein